MTVEELLKETLLFARLEPSYVKSIAQISSERKYPPGEAIFNENDEAMSILIVKSGLIRISKGAENIEITRLGPRQALGELSFLDNGIRSATATAVEPTLLLRIPAAELRELIDENAELAREFYKGAAHYVANRLRVTTGDLQFSKEFVAKHAKYF